MERVPLSDTRITDPISFEWLAYFQDNAAHLPHLDFTRKADLSEAEKSLITPSIRAFQLGEGSDGRCLLHAAEQFAAQTEYREYPEIMRYFIGEENRHSHTLKRYMALCGIEPAQRVWIDSMFRFLRKRMGLFSEVTVLVTAEIIALSYYKALSEATQSALLKNICAQMLYDELRHVVFQSATLFRLRKVRPLVVPFLRRALMRVTAFVVWHSFRPLFLKGGYTRRCFFHHCMEYLTESIAIEKSGICSAV